MLQGKVDYRCVLGVVVQRICVNDLAIAENPSRPIWMVVFLKALPKNIYVEPQFILYLFNFFLKKKQGLNSKQGYRVIKRFQA